MCGRDLGSPQVSDLESLEDRDAHQDGRSEEKDVAAGRKRKQVGVVMP